MSRAARGILTALWALWLATTFTLALTFIWTQDVRWGWTAFLFGCVSALSTIGVAALWELLP